MPAAVKSTCTDIQPALQVADADAMLWDDHCDVLVIGWGQPAPALPLRHAPRALTCWSPTVSPAAAPAPRAVA